MKNWGDWFAGLVCYQRNELQAAAQHFTQIADHRYSAQITTYRDAVAGLALIYQIQGERATAWQMVDSISQFDLEQQGHEDERTGSLRARLMLLQGDLEGASRWADTFSGPPPDRPFFWLEEPRVTRARILVARGRATDLQAALQILDALNEIADRTHNTRYKIEIMALRALALNAQGNSSSAITAAADELKQAIELARPGGFIRVFADLGQPMREMLRRLMGQAYNVETIRRILSAFPEEDNHLDSSGGAARHPAVINSTLVEPLTPRELEVLTLLQEPLSIKEIALQLNTSYATARRHTINLYGKLGVNRRWDAVAQAKELGLLSPR